MLTAIMPLNHEISQRVTAWSLQTSEMRDRLIHHGKSLSVLVVEVLKKFSNTEAYKALRPNIANHHTHTTSMIQLSARYATFTDWLFSSQRCLIRSHKALACFDCQEAPAVGAKLLLVWLLAHLPALVVKNFQLLEPSFYWFGYSLVVMLSPPELPLGVRAQSLSSLVMALLGPR